MRSIQLFSLTSSGTFLFLQGNHVKQGTFEGLHFDNSMLSRHILQSYFKNQIQCSMSKNNNKIRYHNLPFYEEMIKLNVAKINPIEFQDTKVFTPEEKDKLIKISTQIDTQKLLELSKKIIDYSTDRKQLLQVYSKNKNFQAKFEYLHEQINISFEDQGMRKYVPIKLRNIDHYFQLIQKLNLGRFLVDNKNVAVSLVGCKYNLMKKRYELEAVLPENIQRKILQQGWGTVALKNMCYMKPTLYAQYRKIEQQAKAAHKGIFSKPFEILSLIYTKNNLVAVVEEIIQGYIFKIRAKNDEVIKIELAKIHCPIQNQPGAFACREFARKNLIGRQVNVFLTKDEGLNILGSLVRFSDNKDIETLMIENGYGFVKQQLKGTMFYAKLETLEKKAKQFRKGIHNQKAAGVQYYEDFTTGNSKKQKLDKKNTIQSKQRYLQQIQTGEEGVVHECVDPVTYIIRIDSHKKMIRVKLDGVARLVANPRLPQVQQLHKASKLFLYRSFHHRTITLELTQYNENLNSFIGILRLASKGKEKTSFQEILLSQGFVTLSNNGFLQQKWEQCERQAEKKQLNCWNKSLKQFIRKDIFGQQPKQFVGKFSWVEDGELAFVQPNSAQDRLDQIYDVLQNKQNLKPVAQQDLVPGYLCAAQYLQQYCRAKIVAITNKEAVVKFVDWGNKETVPLQSLRQIPIQLQYIPSLCCEIVLDLIAPLHTKNQQHLQRLREFLMEGQCKFVKSVLNIVNVYRDNIHLNTALIHEGYVKADLSKIPDETQRKIMTEQMNRLRKQLVGVWDLQELELEADDEYYAQYY